MYKSIKFIIMLLVVIALQGCLVTQPIPSTQLKASENSAFTSDGRFFVIGKNAANEHWIFEITRNSNGTHAQRPYVKGTLNGTQGGLLTGAPLGSPCSLVGLTAKGKVLYAICSDQSQTQDMALFEVQTTRGSERVRTGRMSLDNFIAEPGKNPFKPGLFFANGMAVDQAGHIYVTNSLSNALTGTAAVAQIKIISRSHPSYLDFTHKTWLNTGAFGADVFPNGLQIENNILYYATANQIRKVRINSDYSAGTIKLHYQGVITDDFELHQGYIALASLTLPGALVILPPGTFDQTVTPLQLIPLTFLPSSVIFQQDLPVGNPLFEENALLVTSFFNGGLFQVTDY